MLTGKPVVATNWSGNTDFFDATTGCPVEFTLRPVESGEYPYADGQVWAEPDLGSAMVLLPICFGLLFVGGVRVKHLLLVIGLGLVLAPLAWLPGAGRRNRRCLSAD